jgi:hypothetical protein
VISLNLVLAELRLGLKNRQVGEKWVADDCSSVNVVDKLNIPVYFLGGMRIKDLEKTRKLGAQGIAGVSAF